MTSWPQRPHCKDCSILQGCICTNIRKIRPFLTEHAAQLLVQALSFLGWTTAMLFWLDFDHAQSNLCKWFRMQRHNWSSNEPKSSHVTPLFIFLHWLPVAARIKFKTLMLAYRTTTGSAPAYFHSLLRIYIPSRSLRSTNERRLVVPSQRGDKITFQNIFVHCSWLVEWSSHPYPECWIPDNF